MWKYYRKHPPISYLLEGRFGWKIPEDAANKGELMKLVARIDGGIVNIG